MFKKNSHCSYCGSPFLENQPWPRTCANCGHVSFLNPAPVAVVLAPVDAGLLIVRRGIEPQKGKLALPGGYIDFNESWQQAAAREVWEETGVVIEPQELELFTVLSPSQGEYLLIFGLAQRRTSASLPLFTPTKEATERLILTAPEELAFPLHTQAIKAFFR